MAVDVDNVVILVECALSGDFFVNEVLHALIAAILIDDLESIFLFLGALDDVDSAACACSDFPIHFVLYLADFYLVVDEHTPSYT